MKINHGNKLENEPEAYQQGEQLLDDILQPILKVEKE